MICRNSFPLPRPRLGHGEVECVLEVVGELVVGHLDGCHPSLLEGEPYLESAPIGDGFRLPGASAYLRRRSGDPTDPGDLQAVAGIGIGVERIVEQRCQMLSITDNRTPLPGQVVKDHQAPITDGDLGADDLGRVTVTRHPLCGSRAYKAKKPAAGSFTRKIETSTTCEPEFSDTTGT